MTELSQFEHSIVGLNDKSISPADTQDQLKDGGEELRIQIRAQMEGFLMLNRDKRFDSDSNLTEAVAGQLQSVATNFDFTVEQLFGRPAITPFQSFRLSYCDGSIVKALRFEVMSDMTAKKNLYRVSDV